MTSRRNCIFAMLLAISTTGCANFWYELQPHRLKKLNSGPAPSLNPEFTYQSPDQGKDLIRRIRPTKPVAMTANSAEVTLARGQNQD